MIQPQLLNLVSNLQDKALPNKGRSNSRPVQKHDFGNIMDMGGNTLSESAVADLSTLQPGTLSYQEEDTSSLRYDLLKTWPIHPENEEPFSFLVLAPIMPPVVQVDDFSPSLITENVLQIMDDLVFILEGNYNDTNVNKEIVPLLAKLSEILRQAEQPLPPEFTEELEEVMARMPQTFLIAEKPQQTAKLTHFIETLRGYLCPPGNANERSHIPPLPQEESMPAIRTIASTMVDSGQAAFTKDEEFSRSFSFTREAGQAIIEEASFNIAPARIAFAERFGLAAQHDQPFTIQNLFSAMVERIISLPEASPHMEISLKPDHLGKLNIDLRLGENGLSARILTSDEGVRNLLAAHIDRLSDTLAERGMRLDNVEVIYAALSEQSFGQRQGADEEAWESSGRPALGQIEPANEAPQENTYDVPPIGYNGEWGYNSVEYFA